MLQYDLHAGFGISYLAGHMNCTEWTNIRKVTGTRRRVKGIQTSKYITRIWPVRSLVRFSISAGIVDQDPVLYPWRGNSWLAVQPPKNPFKQIQYIQFCLASMNRVAHWHQYRLADLVKVTSNGCLFVEYQDKEEDAMTRKLNSRAIYF